MSDVFLAFVKRCCPGYDWPEWTADGLREAWNLGTFGEDRMAVVAEQFHVDRDCIESLVKTANLAERERYKHAFRRMKDSELALLFADLQEKYGDPALRKAFRSLDALSDRILFESLRLDLPPQLVEGVVRIQVNLRLAGPEEGGSGPAVSAALKPPPWLPRGLHRGVDGSAAQSFPEEDEETA